jgi:hypothetical protein
VSNGDIGFQGREEKDKLNMTGTTHGSIVEINHQWYVFYHRLTHKSDYSRQACAEKIYIEEDGRIPQVEITSCGLNEGALRAEAGNTYPAVIACNLTNGHMPHGSNSVYNVSFPNVTNCGEERFIAEIEDGTLIGYKYFDFHGIAGIQILARQETDKNRVIYEGPVRLDERCTELPAEEAATTKELAELAETAEATAANESVALTATASALKETAATAEVSAIEVRLQPNGPSIGKIVLGAADTWTAYQTQVKVPDGVHALYFIYHGQHRIQIKELQFL